MDFVNGHLLCMESNGARMSCRVAGDAGGRADRVEAMVRKKIYRFRAYHVAYRSFASQLEYCRLH